MLAKSIFLQKGKDFSKWLRVAPSLEEPFTGMENLLGLGTEHRLFQFQRQFYFLNSARLGAEFMTVDELKKDGAMPLTCKVRMAPDGNLVRQFSELPGLKPYLDRLRIMGGTGDGDCGSGHFTDYHYEERNSAVWRTALRPWATSSATTENHPYYEYGERLLLFLKDWSYADAWSFREYQTYQHHIGPAQQALARYYSNYFGLPAAVSQRRAEMVFQELTAAHFQVTKDYTVGDGYAYTYGPFANVESAALMRQGVILGDREAVLLSLPADKEELNRGRYLLDAVEYPVILKALLDTGADIDTPNHFGKSALMVAPHMNRPDSVRLLLQAGVDPNLETTDPQDRCAYTIHRINRTALMYAAENADIDVMQILVDAGAKADAKDSDDNGMSYYLSSNPYITTAQKRMSLVELLASTKQDSVPAPSFDCTTAKQRIEKLICKGPILARQDRNLATAFTTWKSKTESPSNEKSD